MRLSSQGSQFIFNLPSDFLPSEIIATYQPILEKNWVQYENVIDYLNSTIKSVNFPGITIETPIQTIMRGKQIAYKPSRNVQDIVGHDLQIKFASVDSDLNYWLMFDIVTKHYLDVENLFLSPITITALDIHRDGIYVIKFFQVILKSLGGNTFDYSQQKVSAKEFELTFSFNFYDIEFLLNQSKVLELGSVPQIIQKI
jgi:hypothetical protein